MDDKKNVKNAFKYVCEKCDFNSNNKYDYTRHLQTKKHNDYIDYKKTYKCLCGKVFKYRQNYYRHKKVCEYKNYSKHNDKWINMDKKWIKMDKNKKCPFLCVCGNAYKFQSGLSKHKKTCSVLLLKQQESQQLVSGTENHFMEEMKDMFKDMLMQNNEIMSMSLDIAREPKIVNNNTQFNVMNYLNTECKDAMNLSDFINQFTFSLEDLELLGTKGYQKAMEQTFVKQLKDMDKTKRPIHCSDKKRKSFYVKENDIWEKDNNNLKIVLGIKKLARKHFNTINTWRHNNVDWLDNDMKHDFFNKSVVEVGKCDKIKETSKVLSNLTELSLR